MSYENRTWCPLGYIHYFKIFLDSGLRQTGRGIIQKSCHFKNDIRLERQNCQFNFGSQMCLQSANRKELICCTGNTCFNDHIFCPFSLCFGIRRSRRGGCPKTQFY